MKSLNLSKLNYMNSECIFSLVAARMIKLKKTIFILISTFAFSGEIFEGVVPGHEICGVVEELGKGAEENTSLKIGKRDKLRSITIEYIEWYCI